MRGWCRTGTRADRRVTPPLPGLAVGRSGLPPPVPRAGHKGDLRHLVSMPWMCSLFFGREASLCAQVEGSLRPQVLREACGLLFLGCGESEKTGPKQCLSPSFLSSPEELLYFYSYFYLLDPHPSLPPQCACPLGLSPRDWETRLMAPEPSTLRRFGLRPPSSS